MESQPGEAGPASTIDKFIEGRASDPERRARVQHVARQLLALGDVEMQPGQSSKSRDRLGDYFMVKYSGRTEFGSAAYIYPSSGRVELRLEHEEAAGYQHAHLLQVQADNPYKVATYLNSDEEVEETLRLLQRALDIVAGR